MSPDRLDRARLVRELRALITESTPGLNGSLDVDAPLITSGVLESTTLVGVALWVEKRIGRAMDLSAFDLVAEWNSLSTIVDFVERHGARPGAARQRDG